MKNVFMQAMQKENLELRTAYAAEKAARAKSLSKMSALRGERVAQN